MPRHTQSNIACNDGSVARRRRRRDELRLTLAHHSRIPQPPYPKTVTYTPAISIAIYTHMPFMRVRSSCCGVQSQAICKAVYMQNVRNMYTIV